MMTGTTILLIIAAIFGAVIGVLAMCLAVISADDPPIDATAKPEAGPAPP